MSSFHNVEKSWQVAGPGFDAVLWEPENIFFRGRNGSVLEGARGGEAFIS